VPDPPVVHFGAVSPGCGTSTKREVVLHNPGNQPVQVNRMPLVGCTGELALAGWKFGKVAGSSSQGFDVKLTPASAGYKSCQLRIIAADGAVMLPVTARVVSGPRQTDTFLQDARRRVDALVMLDRSGSMQDDLNTLANNISALAQAASGTKARFHLGVAILGTGKNGEPPGGLVGQPRVLGRSVADLGGKLATRVRNVGSGGVEAGLEAINAAVSPPLASGRNAGFRRRGASLEVLVVSDEDVSEQSSMTEGELRAALARRVNPVLGQTARVHGLLEEDHCAGSQKPLKWRRLIANTGGMRQDLCAKSLYTRSLKALAQQMLGLRDRFFLTGQPASGTLKVKKGGKELSAPSDYTYNARANMVRLRHAPADGAVITLSYQLRCP
jgi:hypothetical protein